MSFQDKYALGLGNIVSATFNVDSSNGFANINTNVTNQMLPGDSSFSTPCMFPYGFLSIPPDGSIAVTMNIAGNPYSPLVIGQIPNTSNLYVVRGISVGYESVVYSNNYSLLAKTTGLMARLNNMAGSNECNLLWGENVVKVLEDIINQLLTLYNTDLPAICAALSPPLTPPTINPDISTDLTALEAGQAYINNDGAPIT